LSIEWIKPLHLECENIASTLRFRTQPRAHGIVGLEVVRIQAVSVNGSNTRRLPVRGLCIKHDERKPAISPFDSRPDDHQATHLGREQVNLVDTLTNVAEQTLDGVGYLDIAAHRLRKLVKGQGFLYLFSQTSHRLWIELAIFGFEGGNLHQGPLLVRLCLDAQKFCLYFTARSPGDGVQDVALLEQETSLEGCRRKQFLHRSQ